MKNNNGIEDMIKNVMNYYIKLLCIVKRFLINNITLISNEKSEYSID